MKLKNIKISNYRCFKETEIDFEDHITLVVGKNGAGKTAILDAVAGSGRNLILCSGCLSQYFSARNRWWCKQEYFKG